MCACDKSGDIAQSDGGGGGYNDTSNAAINKNLVYHDYFCILKPFTDTYACIWYYYTRIWVFIVFRNLHNNTDPFSQGAQFVTI